MIIRIWTKLRDFYLNLKIGKKLLLMYLVAFMIPFVLLVVYGYGMVQGLLVDRIRYEMDNDVSRAGQGIESTFDNYVTAAYTVVFDKEIQYFLQDDYKDDSYMKAYGYIKQRLDSIIAINPGIISFSIYTNNGTMPSDGDLVKRIDDDVRSQAWYKAMRADGQRRFVFLPQLRQEKTVNGKVKSEKYVFTVYMRLPYYVGKYNDIYYCMDIDQDTLGLYLKQNNTSKEMLLLDQAGKILTSEDKSLLGKTPGSILDLSSGFIGDTGWFDTYRSSKPNEKLLVRYKILKNGWKVVSFISYNSFLSVAKRKSLQLLAVYAAFLPLLVLLLYLTSQIWTKRIRTIIKMMNQLEQGNFHIKGNYENGDEFNEMLRSFVKMSSKIGNLIKEVYVKEVSKKETELNNLQFLINPHFLYNTLSSIRATANKNNDKQTSFLIDRLARFYRIALSKGSTLITIRDEISLLNCYLDLQKERFVNQINTHYELDESLLELKTLKLVLQPFVENSINHGIWNQDACINIVIQLYWENGCIVFKIIDDGLGFDMRKRKGKSSDLGLTGGFGITNVDERIKLSFGSQYGVSIQSLYGIGTCVEIAIPQID